MAWIYEQSTGRLYHNGSLKGSGYSGKMTNKNNPDRQQVKSLGPLPRGTYRIGSTTRSLGPLTIELHQTSGETFGRKLFRIHGERTSGPSGWASEGCIIMPRSTRLEVKDSIDRVLEVVR